MKSSKMRRSRHSCSISGGRERECMCERESEGMSEKESVRVRGWVRKRKREREKVRLREFCVSKTLDIEVVVWSSGMLLQRQQNILSLKIAAYQKFLLTSEACSPCGPIPPPTPPLQSSQATVSCKWTTFCEWTWNTGSRTLASNWNWDQFNDFKSQVINL